MAREFAVRFYHSDDWKTARELCMMAHYGMCARCMKAGRFVHADIVHHKVPLTPENINDPSVSLSQSNLEPLCRKCHAKEHPEIYSKTKGCHDDRRYAFDENGNLVRVGGMDWLPKTL